MYIVDASYDKKPKNFYPFTLNIRLTTKESAENLRALLLPAAHDFSQKGEQHKMAIDIRKMITDHIS